MTKKILAPKFKRFLAFLLDVSLTSVMYHLLLSFEGGRLFEARLIEFGSYLDTLIPLKFQFAISVGKLLFFYLIYFFQKLMSTLIMGCSLGQFISGISSDNALIANRALGFVRILFEFVLTPFLIFDLPLLKNKPTFKELLSFTRLQAKPGIGIFRGLFIIPLAFSLQLIAPMFNNLTLIDGVKVNFKQQSKEKLNKDSSFSKFKYYSSNYYKFSTFSSLEEGRFSLIPSFEIYKIKKSKKVSPYLRIYDLKKKVYGQFRVHKKFSLIDYLKIASEDNLFFRVNYPNLSKLLASQNVFQPLKYSENLKDAGHFNNQVKNEISHLVKAGFEIKFTGLLDHVLNNGPFLGGYIRLRSELLKLISGGVIPELVDIVKLGKEDFLRFQYIDENENSEFTSKEYLIPLSSPNSMIYEYAWQKGMSANISKNDFRQSFFSSINWYHDFKGIFSPPQSYDFYDPLIIMDFYLNDQIESKSRTILEDYIHQYFYKISKQSLVLNDDQYRKLILSSLSRFALMAEWKNKKEQEYYSLHFVRKILRLKNALDRSDLTFFGE